MGRWTASSERDWLAIVLQRAGDAVPFTPVVLIDGEPVGSVSICWDDIDDRHPDERP